MKSLNTALTTIRRSPFQSLTAILIMSVTFFVGFAFSLLAIGAEQVLRYFETRPQVIAFFELETEQSAINQAKQQLESKDYVESVKIVNQEEALRIYQESNKDEPLLLELVTSDILPASMEVAAKDLTALPKIREDLEGIREIDDIDLQESIINQLQNWTRSIRYLGIGIVVVLAGISFLTIAVVIAMKAASQKKAIGIMRMIGATKGFIKWPFVIEGMLYSLSGAVLGWIVMYTTLLYATPSIQNFLGEIQLLPVPWQFLLIQASIGLGCAILIGGLAGMLAVNRLIKK